MGRFTHSSMVAAIADVAQGRCGFARWDGGSDGWSSTAEPTHRGGGVVVRCINAHGVVVSAMTLSKRDVAAHVRRARKAVA